MVLEQRARRACSGATARVETSQRSLGPSGGDVDLGADRGELPQRDGVVTLLTDAAVRLRRAQLSTVCTSSPLSIGMSWKPMAAPLVPSVKRTKYSIVPESSIPHACSDLE